MVVSFLLTSRQGHPDRRRAGNPPAWARGWRHQARLWPPSAVGLKHHQALPSITVMPCWRPYRWPRETLRRRGLMHPHVFDAELGALAHGVLASAAIICDPTRDGSQVCSRGRPRPGELGVAAKTTRAQPLVTTSPPWLLGAARNSAAAPALVARPPRRASPCVSMDRGGLGAYGWRTDVGSPPSLTERASGAAGRRRSPGRPRTPSPPQHADGDRQQRRHGGSQVASTPPARASAFMTTLHDPRLDPTSGPGPMPVSEAPLCAEDLDLTRVMVVRSAT